MRRKNEGVAYPINSPYDSDDEDDDDVENITHTEEDDKDEQEKSTEFEETEKIFGEIGFVAGENAKKGKEWR